MPRIDVRQRHLAKRPLRIHADLHVRDANAVRHASLLDIRRHAEHQRGGVFRPQTVLFAAAADAWIVLPIMEINWRQHEFLPFRRQIQRDMPAGFVLLRQFKPCASRLFVAFRPEMDDGPSFRQTVRQADRRIVVKRHQRCGNHHALRPVRSVAIHCIRDTSLRSAIPPASGGQRHRMRPLEAVLFQFAGGDPTAIDVDHRLVEGVSAACHHQAAFLQEIRQWVRGGGREKPPRRHDQHGEMIDVEDFRIRQFLRRKDLRLRYRTIRQRHVFQCFADFPCIGRAARLADGRRQPHVQNRDAVVRANRFAPLLFLLPRLRGGGHRRRPDSRRGIRFGRAEFRRHITGFHLDVRKPRLSIAIQAGMGHHTRDSIVHLLHRIGDLRPIVRSRQLLLAVIRHDAIALVVIAVQ